MCISSACLYIWYVYIYIYLSIYPVRIFCQDFTRHSRLRCPTSCKSHKRLAFWWPHLPLHLPPSSCTWFLKELGPSSCRCARSRFCLAFLRSNWASTRQGLFQVVPCSGLFRPFKQRVSRELKWTGSTGMYGLVSFVESTLPFYRFFTALMVFVVKAGFMALLPKSPPPAVHCKGVNDAPKKPVTASWHCKCPWHVQVMTSLIGLEFDSRLWQIVTFFWSATPTNGVTARASAGTHHRWPTVLESISRWHPPPQILSFWHRCCTIHGHILQGLAAYDILHRCSPSLHYRASLLASPVSQTLEVGPEMQASL